MPSNAHDYREQLYRLRAHPSDVPADFVDRRDSFTRVYLSAIPFLMVEYYFESHYDGFPSGLMFPTGFLLYWAFYYTYYQPGFLENKLSAIPQKKDVMMLPAVLLGVLIWFMKVTVVELGHLLLFRWVIGAKPSAAKPKQPPHPPHQSRAHQQYKHYQKQANRTRTAQEPPRPPPASGAKKVSLPLEVREALSVLGLSETNDWNEVHHRYRELAKKYHPDLNRDITQVGNRFMRFDAAYRKLAAVKTKYFTESKRA